MQKLKEYTKHPGSFLVFILIILATVITVGTMVFLVAYILIRGIPNITPELFEWEYTSENVSMMPAIINTILMTGFTLLMAVPVGVFSAVYLAEYSKKGSKLVKLIRLTVETLAGIPSIVYGLFGFLAFVIALKWEYSFLAGVAQRERRHSCFALDALMVVKVDIAVNHLVGFREGRRFVAVDTLRFEDRKEIFCHCIVIRVSTS